MVDLLEPLEVRGVRLRNRIVMLPMGTDLAAEGFVTQHTIDHYVRRSKNLGLLIVEHSYVSAGGMHNRNQIGIANDRQVSGLEKLSSSIHAEDTRTVIQINHCGKRAKEQVIGMQPVAPSSNGNARALLIQEVEALTEAFAKAAERAVRAGFDGVEIHGAHGHLLNQFLSPLANKREDKYGGSLQNRMEFPLEVVGSIRERIDRSLLFYRMGADDLDPGGITIEDSRKFAVELEKAGVDIIDVSGGMCGHAPACLQGIQGYFVPQAQAIKEVVTVPVIGVGGINDPEFADKLIRERRVDLVGVGRALLNDPDWVVNAVEKLMNA